MTLLGAIKRLFVAEDQDSLPDYEGDNCPHCDLGLSESGLVNEKTGVRRTMKHCSWCGWNPKSDPDRSPEEAQRRAVESHEALGEMLRERGLR